MRIAKRKMGWLTGALLLSLVAAPLAQAFYNSSTGRWLSRDPIGERGGNDLYGFVNNAAVSQFDLLGLKCCVLLYPRSSFEGRQYSHTAIECDNGVYISAYPGHGDAYPPDAARFRTKEDDEKYFGKPTSNVCLDCIDANAVAAWIARTPTVFDGFCNNCSDIGRDAILAGLPEQKQPTCPSCNIPEHHYRVVDLMEDPSIGPSFPGTLDRQLKALKENDCQRFKCKLVFTARRPVF